MNGNAVVMDGALAVSFDAFIALYFGSGMPGTAHGIS
jgi:hypothetical protein